LVVVAVLVAVVLATTVSDYFWLQAKLVQSDKEGVVPSISISSGEQERQRLSSSNLKIGIETFTAHSTEMFAEVVAVLPVIPSLAEMITGI